MTERGHNPAAEDFATFAAETARLLGGAWGAVPRPGLPGEAGLVYADQYIHLRYNPRSGRVSAQGVDPLRARTENRFGRYDYLGARATVSRHRGSGPLAQAIKERVLPSYLSCLHAARGRAAAREQAALAHREDVGRLLAAISAGQVRTAFTDALLAAWRPHEQGPATVSLHARREPGTVELTVSRVPVQFAAALAAAVDRVLGGGADPAPAPETSKIERF